MLISCDARAAALAIAGESRGEPMKRPRSEKRQGFFNRVYELVRRVPPGRVVTYGQVAEMLGDPRQARTVGWAIAGCPEDVPWHRVLNSRGEVSRRAGDASGERQRAMLRDEGVEFNAYRRADLKRFGWDPEPRELFKLLSGGGEGK